MNRKIMTALTIIFIIGIIFAGCDNFNLIELLNNDIALVPESSVMQSGDILKFNIISTVSPYTLSILNDESGDIDSIKGEYTAPATASAISRIIQLKDSANRIAIAKITVIAEALRIDPTIASAEVGGPNINFTVTGGGLFTIFSVSGTGGGSIDTSTGVYSPGTNLGTDIVVVEDELGSISEAAVTLVSGGTLIVNPQTAEIFENASIDIIVSGGVGTYLYSPLSAVVIGIYSVAAIPPDEKITYTAPNFTGLAEITVSDGAANSQVVRINVVSSLLTLSPQAVDDAYVGMVTYFSASGGSSPYIYSIAPEDSESASIGSATGVFTALKKDSTVIVIVTDSNGTQDTCRVKIKNK